MVEETRKRESCPICWCGHGDDTPPFTLEHLEAAHPRAVAAARYGAARQHYSPTWGKRREPVYDLLRELHLTGRR